MPTVTYEIVDGVLDGMRAGKTSSPVSGHLSMQVVDFDRGKAVYEMQVGPELTNAMGVLQGGVATVLADAAMAAASMTMLDDEAVSKESVTTVQLNSRYLRPVRAGEKLRGDARVVRSGRQLVWAECDVTADDTAVGKFEATGIRVPFDPSQMVTPEKQ
jgi:uncharacterized protein (TIGR00369 family)